MPSYRVVKESTLRACLSAIVDIAKSQQLDQLVQDSTGLKSGHPSVSPHILRLSHSFPFVGGSWDVPSSLDLIIYHLPEKLYAVSLCETYFTRVIWYSDIVSMDELNEDILGPVYTYMEAVNSRQDQPYAENVEALPISPHRLAILFFVLAIGSLVDINLPLGSTQAEDYFELGKACLALTDVFVMPELGTLQALFLAHLYYHHGSPRYSPEAAWSIMGLCVRLVHTVSVHASLLDLHSTHPYL